MNENTTAYLPGCEVCGRPYPGTHHLNCPRTIPAPCPGCAERDAWLTSARAEIERLNGEGHNLHALYRESEAARERAERAVANGEAFIAADAAIIERLRGGK
jgi:hypothetical protein